MQKNKNRPGYKETKVGWIPRAWNCKPFSNVFGRRSEAIPVKPSAMYQEIGVRSHGKGVFHKAPVTGKDLGNKRVFECCPGALVFNIVFAWEQAVAVISENERGLIASHRFPMYIGKKGIADEQFARWFFRTPRGKYGLSLASPGGAGRNKTLGQGELDYLFIPLPPLPEQKAIAEVLSCWDEGIEKLEKLIDTKKLRKKGLMQKLLTGEKRLPGFFGDWKDISLNQLMKESRMSGSDGASAKKLTVKLHGKGVTKKNETRAGSDATKYYKRTAGQFIYSKLDFLNGAFGIIPPLLDGYESTLDLPAFDLKADIVNSTWLISFLTREEFYISCYALANGGRKARRINPKDFKHIKLFLPPIEEQKAIAKVLETADEEIRLLEVERDALAEQKKGLMQKLLTGEIRCPEFRGEQTNGVEP
jgi:type I restriction enzyme S subunit